MTPIEDQALTVIFMRFAHGIDSEQFCQHINGLQQMLEEAHPKQTKKAISDALITFSKLVKKASIV